MAGPDAGAVAAAAAVDVDAAGVAAEEAKLAGRQGPPHRDRTSDGQHRIALRESRRHPEQLVPL